MLNEMRQQRLGIRSAEAAAAAHGIESLPALIALPKDRLYVYTKLLKNLEDRTPKTHPCRRNIEKTVRFFKDIERQVWEEKNREKLRAQVKRLEKQFKPSIVLSSPSRVFYHDAEIKILENKKPVSRHVWLFNDLIVYGRSSWLNAGFYRHKGSVKLSEYGNSPDFGPLAFYVSNTAGHRLILIASNEKEKQFWMKQLSRCPGTHLSEQDQLENDQLWNLQQQIQASLVLEETKPPPPPREEDPILEPELPSGWIELLDENTNNVYYYNESLGVTQWEKPQR